MLAKIFNKFPKVYSAYMWFGSILIGWMVAGLKLVMGHFHRLYKSKSEFWICYEPLISSLGGEYSSGERFGERTISWPVSNREDHKVLDMKEIDIMSEDDADLNKAYLQNLAVQIKDTNTLKNEEPS